MDILYALQEIRTPFLDALMSFITLFGEETLLLAVGLVVLWCVDKKWGYRLFYLGLFGGAVNQLLKAIFLVPRPWVTDPSFKIVESARAGATGYSFPSGHTQGAAMLFGGFALWLRRRWMTVLAIVFTLLVGFSRLYLGVHTPLDVGVSLLTGVLVVCVAGALFRYADTNRRAIFMLGAIGLAMCLAAVFYMLFAPVGEANIVEFDLHGLESAFSLLGGMLGLFVIYWMDETYLHFPVKAVWWAQIIKCVMGLGIVLAVQTLLKDPLDALFSHYAAAKAVRYFLMAVAGGALWPMTFRWFSKFPRR